MSEVTPQEKARALLAALWQKNLPVLQQRVALLELAAEAAAAGTLSAGDRSEAAATAHKLAGSLGMFGYPEGTELARTLEQKLEGSGELDGAELRRLAAELRGALGL